MKKINLNTIIKKCKIDRKIINYKNFQVKGISLHSKEIKNNYIFAAIKRWKIKWRGLYKRFFKFK